MKYIFSLLFVLLFLCSPAQQTEFVDFKRVKVNIAHVDIESKGIGGHAIYEFEVLKDVDSIYFDAKNFKQIECLLDEKIFHNYNGKHLVINHKFKKGEKYQADIGWFTKPKKALYFVQKDSDIQIWTQGQGKYTSNWLPSIDDMNEKIEFDLSITFDSSYQVIANGKLTNKQINKSTTTWQYNMNHPMPSYLVALAIGKYDKKVEYSNTGVPLEMYYYPEDSLKFEPTYRYSKQMFDFLEEEIGFPYPWQNYKQIPVHDFLYAGMENTSATIFSDAFMIDETAFVDKNYVNVNAHELAHQWFGDMVTATHGTHHWLQEGFATYYALLAEKDIFGEDYYYWRLFEYAQELQQQDAAGLSTALLNPKASSTTFYKKGAMALHMLHEFIGDTAFRKAVKNYLIDNQFKNVSTTDFLDAVAEVSGEDLTAFVRDWLNAVDFPYDGVIDHLKHKSKLISSYLVIDCAAKTSKCSEYLTSPDFSDKAKAKIISQIPDRVTSNTFNSSLKVRQSIAKNVTDIPKSIKADYESLLIDKSYITIENALLNLWKNFPNDRAKYLNITKDVIGLPDKNVRLLWLALRLLTENYDESTTELHYKELLSYTSPKYNSQIRQQAFTLLFSIKACNEECKTNLAQAKTHHNWRLKKFAKEMIID